MQFYLPRKFDNVGVARGETGLGKDLKWLF